MSLLEIKGLRKSFGERLIIDAKELTLERGRSYLLTGNNGSGKTTLLRILAGLESAQIDGLSFDGNVLAATDICKHLAPRVIYMHQHPYLFSSSVRANVAYGLKAAGVPHQKQGPLIEEAMTWAGVHHLAHTPPNRLSGGEKQRVALARARVLNPNVLLLDEPTANLDEEARRQVAALIKKMCDNNHCVVIATHDPELMTLKNAVTLHLDNAALQISYS